MNLSSLSHCNILSTHCLVKHKLSNLRRMAGCTIGCWMDVCIESITRTLEKSEQIVVIAFLFPPNKEVKISRLIRERLIHNKRRDFSVSVKLLKNHKSSFHCWSRLEVWQKAKSLSLFWIIPLVWDDSTHPSDSSLRALAINLQLRKTPISAS